MLEYMQGFRFSFGQLLIYMRNKAINAGEYAGFPQIFHWPAVIIYMRNKAINMGLYAGFPQILLISCYYLNEDKAINVGHR